MMSLIVNVEWYEEISKKMDTFEPYFFTEYGENKVEFDADEKEFNRISKELGWME